MAATAEPLVLASVSIDESGVVRGAANAGAAVDKLAGDVDEVAKTVTRSTSDIAKFGEHLTSTASVARALGHTIGAAGLGLAIIEVTKSLVEGTAAWKDFTGGVSEYVDVALRGISVSEELDARLAKLAGEAGIKGSAVAIREENEKAAASLKALQAQGDPSYWRLFLVGLQDAAHFSDAVANYLGTVKEKMDELQPSITKAHEAATFIGPAAPANVGNAGYDPDAFEKDRAKTRKSMLLFNAEAKKLSDEWARDDAKAAAESFRARDKVLKSESAAEAKLYAERLRRIDEEGGLQAAYWGGITERVGEYVNALGAASTMASAFADAGIVSAQRVFQIQHALLAAEDIQKGTGELAAAAASAASFNYASAALHKVAASLYFAAAGAQGVAAIRGPSTSGGSASGGGGFRGTSASLTPRPTQRDIHLTVNVDGNVIGNEQWIRGAIVDIQRQLSDGAGGGSF